MSTQVLTELPRIQKAGMDFDTVMAEMKSIIEENPNWQKNWPEFYDSEAGVMFLQLMSWITDNMTTRQDVLFNEMFLTTANKDVNKVRHLKQIGYVPLMAHAAKVPVRIETGALLQNTLFLTPASSSNIVFRANEIFKFSGKDVNGSETNWEILKIKDGKPSYLDSVALKAGDAEYETDRDDNVLYALQGETKFKSMSTSTSDGPYIDLEDKNIAADSVQVYLISSNGNSELLEVSSFVSKDALDKTLAYPYVIELNEDQTYRVRFANSGVLDKERLLPAGSTVGVFYRTTNGSVGNIPPTFINTTASVTDINKKSYNITITNEEFGSGGSDAESLDKAVLNGPLTLRTMDRAVTPEDYNIILDRNTNIFKAKTYTATNMPLNFKSYYGRYINPQETFSFILFNKKYDGVPTSMYNYFPWFTSANEPRLNERYVFNAADYDMNINIGSEYKNLYLLTNRSNTINFKNATILGLPSDFKNSLFSSDGVANKDLMLKISKEETSANFFKDIAFSLIADDNYNSLTMNNTKLCKDTNARFISQEAYDMDEPIDVSTARYIIVCIDNKTEIKIDLQADRDESMTDEDKYYLLWSNEGVSNAKALYGTSTTKNVAKYRNGIVQIINNSLPAAISGDNNDGYVNEIELYKPGTSYQHLNLNMTSSYSVLPYQDDDYDFSFKVNGVTYVSRFSASEWTQGLVVTDPSLYSWNSLLGIRDILNKIFKDNYHLKRYVDGVLEEIPAGTYPLGHMEATVEQCLIYNTDYDTDDDISGTNKNVYSSYDIIIKGTELTSISYSDEWGIHTFNNVIDFNDTKDLYIGGKNYQGLIHFIKRSTSPLDGRNIIPAPLQAATYGNLARMIVDEESNTGFLEIKSPIIGSSSSIFFKKNNNETNFMKDFLKCYFSNDGYSYKAYGQRKCMLITEDIIKSYIIQNGLESAIESSIGVGDVIFENNSIYNSDFVKLFANYKLSTNSSLILGSVYENFYYSGDELLDEEVKEDVKGLSGQYMAYETLDSGVKSYYIDQNKSNFEIKLTKEKQDTNSLYAITSDLDVVGCDRVTVSSADIVGCPSDTCPLIFSIDEYDYEKLVVMLNRCNSGKEVVDAIQLEIKNTGNANLINNLSSIIKSSYKSMNQIIFSGLTKNDGNITFYYPSYDYAVSDLEVQDLYRNIFGTNISNSEFYRLYPKEDFARFVINVSEDEYFYCPTEDNPLEFKYRKLVEKTDPETGLVTSESREADYYIEVDEASNGDQYTYRFRIVKTNNSRFPDTYFYMHFINNKQYDFDANNNVKETDDTIMQNYMKKYKISGTDVIFLQPYFRTYDIAATIKYNSNFSETEVVQGVRAAVQKVCQLKDSEIAGSMSRAKILKAIMNSNGVEDCKITYFGFDYASGTGNTDLLQADFYEILCLHEDSDRHGMIFTYEVAGE